MKHQWVLPTTSTNLLDEYKKDYVQYSNKAREELATLMRSSEKKDRSEADRQIIEAMEKKRLESTGAHSLLSPIPISNSSTAPSSISDKGAASTPISSKKLAPILHTPLSSSQSSSSSSISSLASVSTPTIPVKAAHGFLSPLDLKTTPYSPSPKKSKTGKEGGSNASTSAAMPRRVGEELPNSGEVPPLVPQVERDALASFFKGPTPEPPLTGVTLRLQELSIKLRSSQDLKGFGNSPAHAYSISPSLALKDSSEVANSSGIENASTTSQTHVTETKKKNSKDEKGTKVKGEKGEDEGDMHEGGNAVRRLKEEQRQRREEKKRNNSSFLAKEQDSKKGTEKDKGSAGGGVPSGTIGGDGDGFGATEKKSTPSSVSKKNSDTKKQKKQVAHGLFLPVFMNNEELVSVAPFSMEDMKITEEKPVNPEETSTPVQSLLPTTTI
jgi:hypothetical protein